MRALISLGSNIDKEQNLPSALAALQHHVDIEILAISPVYATTALDSKGLVADQPEFHNAAALIKTTLTVEQLRAALRQIEEMLGRVRTSDKFAARTIDLDIAMVEQATIRDCYQTVLNGEIEVRAHVAIPLAAIAPEWRHPQSGLTLRQIADNLATDEMEIIRQ